jgi:hypothetical protein
MRLTMICALFVAIICTLCITQQAVADETGRPIVLPDEYATQTKDDGFQQIKLLDSPGSGFNTLPGVRFRESAVNTPAAERARLEGIGPEMFKVLSVIGRRTGDRKLLEKVRYKLSTMSDNRLRLAVSLSERASGGHGVRTDIAFFLLSTLIVFS